MKNWFHNHDAWEIAQTFLLAIGLVVVCFTFRDYGVSWDDEYTRFQGADFVRWYASGFRDRSVLSPVTSEYIYGSFFSAPATVFAALRIFPPYESVHLAVALVGLFGLFITFAIGRLLGGSRAGFLASLILVLTPAYYGHSFINPKDLPFAVFYLAAQYVLLRLYDHLPRPRLRWITATGVAIGLALAIRVGGVMVLGYVGALVAFWHLAQRRKNPSYGFREAARDIRYTAPAVVGICVIAWIVMIVWWPFAQIDPIRNPLYAIAESARFNGAGFTNLYRGEFIQSGMMPREYLPVMLLVALPEFYALGIGCSLIAATLWAVRARRMEKSAVDNEMKIAFFAFIVLVPLAAALILRPTLYDRARLFLFVIPPLAVVAGLGLNWFFSRALAPYLKALALAAPVLIGCVVLADMVRLHPYEYVYFNRASGGLRGAYGRYDTEYWGTSYKEGMDWLARNYKPNAPPRSIRVANPSSSFLTFYYIASARPEMRRFIQVDLMERSDVILSITRWNNHLVYGGRVLHIVERMGVPLLYVIESTPTTTAEISPMKLGLDRLYVRRDPAGAAEEFRKVLAVDSTHYGATSSLATALDLMGHHDEARALWTRVLKMANQYNDNLTAQTARERLGS